MSMQLLRILQMVAGLLYLMHLLGCFWCYVGTTGGHEKTWLSEYVPIGVLLSPSESFGVLRSPSESFGVLLIPSDSF